MATIRPIRAWRYHPRLWPEIDQLTSPLFDVISKRQRDKLYQNPFNSIHLSVPQTSNPAQAAKMTLESWQRNRTIILDPIPGIYVHYQYFSLPGDPEIHCRKGFIANIKLEPDHEILRHEDTIPHSVQDRIDILDSTRLNASPTHGMYAHDGDEIESLMDESMIHPQYEVEDYQGVRDVFSVIQDPKAIRQISRIMREQVIILADGHHRLQGSLSYQAQCMSHNPDHSGQEGYNFHMMYFTNSVQDHPLIHPTHRLLHGMQLNAGQLLNNLERDFDIREVDNPEDINEIIMGKKWAFGLLTPNGAYRIRLKPDAIQELEYGPDQLVPDLVVLHHFVLYKVFGLSPVDQRNTKRIAYQRNFA